MCIRDSLDGLHGQWNHVRTNWFIASALDGTRRLTWLLCSTAPLTSTVYTNASAAVAIPSATPSPSASTNASTTYTIPSSIPGLTAYTKRALGLSPRQAEPCTVTYTFTTTYGATETYLPASETSTFTAVSYTHLTLPTKRIV